MISHVVRRMQRAAGLELAALLLVLALPVAAAPTTGLGHASAPDTLIEDPSPSSLMGISLEDLIEVKVTSASKREESLLQTPAAAYVVTAEDIRRSGARSIPEVLRLVPGLEVARISGNTWAVSARGFNSRFAGKLLVLVDGHSVYTPLFTGVFWDAQEQIMDDILRIEVIRGPGATLWGANAVNGVINIITRDSEDSQSLLTESSVGTAEHGYVGARFGSRLGVSSTFRVYAMGFSRESLPTSDDLRPQDWRALRGGFRMDWNPGPGHQVAFSGGGQTNDEPQVMSLSQLTPPYAARFLDDASHRGQEFMGRWEWSMSDRSRTTLQANYDHTDRREILGHERRTTLNLDFQHNLALGGNQQTVWGASYRQSSDRIEGFSDVRFSDDSLRESLVGGFVQHEIHTSDRRLALTVGSKFEKPSFLRANAQPSIRAVVMPGARQALWGSFARALRAPSRGERTVIMRLAAFPDAGSGLTVVPTLFGSPTLTNEVLDAFEAGYRVQIDHNLTFDLALYHHHYTSLRSGMPLAPVLAVDGSTPYLMLPIETTSDGEARGRGAEFAVWADPSPHWRLRGGYAYALLEREEQGAAAMANSFSAPGGPPRHSGYVQSLLDLDARWNLDVTLRGVGRLPGTNVPSYVEMDSRIAWHPGGRLELALLGANLLHDSHVEFAQDLQYVPSEIERSFQLFMRLRY